MFRKLSKYKACILILLFVVFICGCGKSEDFKTKEGSDTVQDKNTEAEGSLQKKEGTAVDLDLTALNNNILYAEVYNMMCVPEDYEGKTIKLKGNFSFYNDVSTGKEYFVCMVQDVQACCAQGIEFEPIEKYNGDTCPENGAAITVTGVFTTYEESEMKFCVLKDAEVIVE